jgi:gliding motility-associated-like protein
MRPSFLMVTVIALLLFFADCKAETFIVTSNSDSGPGSLRQALLNAASNGTASTDTILFALPDIARSGRTIRLDSSLPALSSHTVIDGTSQNGTPFGISDARVQIENNISANNFTCFEAIQVNDIQIYGLYLKGFNASFAMHFRQLNNMTFGKPGKGNIVNGFAQAFYSDLIFYTDPPSNNISFQSNLFGIDESGDTANYNTYNNAQFELVNVNNLLIGGLGKDEGNLMCDNNHSMNWTCTRADDSGYLRIEGNKIGTDRTGLKRLIPNSQGLFLNAYNDGSADPLGTSNIGVDIINNICAEGISFFKFKSLFKVQGNRFGVGADNTTNIGQSSYGLIFEFCAQGIIGGSDAADKNYIANFAAGSGVYVFDCGAVTISKNSLFCNGYGIDLGWILPRPVPFVTINKITAAQVGGTALPNSIIELFYDDACPGCEGKAYIGTITADINGNWIYNGANTGGIVATATDTFGATSIFSSATINTDSVSVKDATCGKANGAIKHLRVVSGTDWYWENEMGNIIVHDTDLVNVPPGKYKFVTSIGGSGCKTESMLYEIKNIDQPFIDTSYVSILQPSCGLSNGSLKNNIAFNSTFQYQWLNNANTVLLNDFSLQNPFSNLTPADYYLKVRLIQDSSCFINYGPFRLINQAGPSLITNTMQITNSTCNKNNGAIQNITYQNATGTVYIAWEDSIGKIVSNNLNLMGMAKGRYLLKFKDGSACDTIITPYYVIDADGAIITDVSDLHISPSGCIANTGSISGILQSGAEQIRWFNTASNDTVSTNPRLTNAAPGNYQLYLYNHFGCSALLPSYNIPQSAFINLSVTGSVIHAASCNMANGSIIPGQFTGDTSAYSFVWKDTNNAIIGNHSALLHVNNGTYDLIATDSNGCEGIVFTARVEQLGNPVFDYTAMEAQPDTCNIQAGSIRGITLSGGSPRYTWRWKDSGNNTVDTTSYGIAHLNAGNYTPSALDYNQCPVTGITIAVGNVNKTSPAPIADDQYIPRNTSTTIKIKNPVRGMYQLLNDASPNSTIVASSVDGIFQTPLITADRLFYIRYNYGDCTGAPSRVNIKVFDSTILYVPNAFTPNNDGVNDRLHFTVIGRVSNFSIVIYNRWGNKVYAGTDIAGYWDGNFNGQPLPAGVFVYQLSARDYNNKPISQRGTITILR